jgi:hypothetical protein
MVATKSLSLQDISSLVEKLSKKDHIEILRIIKTHQPELSISENSNGCFINMSSIDKPVVIKIERYIEYCKKKEDELNSQEDKKMSIMNTLN